MRPFAFKLVNDVLLGGPAEKYGTEVDVLDLPICRLEGSVVSCWRPTLRERISILVFGRVWLHSHSETHPPIYIAGHREYLRVEEVEP